MVNGLTNICTIQLVSDVHGTCHLNISEHYWIIQLKFPVHNACGTASEQKGKKKRAEIKDRRKNAEKKNHRRIMFLDNHQQWVLFD